MLVIVTSVMKGQRTLPHAVAAAWRKSGGDMAITTKGEHEAALANARPADLRSGMNFIDTALTSPVVPSDVGLDPDNPASAFGLLRSGMEEGVPGALLTIVGIEGGAPRSPGTHMAVLADGRYCGYVSGGCVEAAVAAEAIAVMQRGTDEVLRFGSKSPFFDIRLPCGGGIDVHVHVRPDPALVATALAHFEARRPFDMAIDARRGRLALLAPGMAMPEGIFRRRYRPRTRLVLIGQGNELPVMASTARAAGLEVSAYAIGPGAASAAARLHTGIIPLDPLQQAPTFDIDAWSAVVFLFHDHASEAVFLQSALRSGAFYIGALGSRRTHADRVERLQAAGFAPSEIAAIHAPIGLIERTREATPLAFSVLADVARERMRLDAAD